MIKFCLLLRANPNGGLAFVVDLVGEFPSSIARHPWNVFRQTVHNVLKCVEIDRTGAMVGEEVIARTATETTKFVKELPTKL
jgi:hypothetical protein